MTSPSPLRFLWAVLLMFVAVGSPDHWPISKTILWGFGWTGFAGIVLWPLTDYAQRRRDAMRKGIVQQITDSPEYKAFIAALEELRKIRNAKGGF